MFIGLFKAFSLTVVVGFHSCMGDHYFTYPAYVLGAN